MQDHIADVYRTRDYESFHYLNGNRDTDERRVQNVIESIKNIGYVMSPIVVNEEMEVIDGQARLAAFRRLDIPVDYVIAVGAGIKECIYLNMKQSAWTTSDYIGSYSKLGNKSYERLMKLYNDYRKLGIQAVLSSVRGVAVKGGSEQIKAGKFECTEEEFLHAKEILDYELSVYQDLKKVGGNSNYYLMAIRFLYDANLIDMDVLREKIHDYKSEMSPVTKITFALEELEAVYNRRSRMKVFGLKGEYLKAMSDKYAWYENKYLQRTS